MSFCDIELARAIPCATVNPAKQVGVYGGYGSIDIGKSADMIILSRSEKPMIDKLIIRGELV